MSIDDNVRNEVNGAMHAALIKCMSCFDRDIIGMVYSHFTDEKAQCEIKVCESIAKFHHYSIDKLKQNYQKNSEKAELIKGYIKWEIQHPGKYKIK